jgi:hypothetical protein
MLRSARYIEEGLTMQRLSAWVRWVLLFIFGSQFALEVFKQVAERIGLYDRP